MKYEVYIDLLPIEKWKSGTRFTLLLGGSAR